METLTASLIILSALFLVVTENKIQLQKTAILLLTGILLSCMAPGFSKEDPQWMLLLFLGGMVAIGWLFAIIPFRFGTAIAAIGTLIFLLSSGSKATYFGFELELTGIVLFLPLLGALGPLILPWKANLLQKWTGVNAEKIVGAGLAFYGALLAFFAVFQAGFLGLILVASGWMAVALANRTYRMESGAFALLAIGFVVVLLKTNPHIDDAFLRGNFLMGLIVGTGAITWINAVKDAHTFRWPLMYIVPLMVVIACVMMGIANPNFGGIPAYAGAIIGSALGLLARSKFPPAIAFVALLLAVSPLVEAQFKPVTLPKKTSRLETKNAEQTSEKQPSVLDVAAVATNATMAGMWKSELDASKVDFELGPQEARTKGAISEFDVQLKLGQNGEPEQLSVDIPTGKITTLNPMRDESVLGPGYIDAKKFPKTGFTATSIKKEGEVYVADGTFEFRGKKQALSVRLKFAAKGTEKGKSYLVMVGEASFDRTQFGMRSDAKIGNVVDVRFEIELRK